MSEEPRFDWPSIFRASGIIIGVTVAIGFIVPVVGSLALGLSKTGYVAGNALFSWAFWVIAWSLTIWQGAWILRHVGDKIIDDMLVVAVICALALIVIKFIIGLVYDPLDAAGQRLFPISAIDAGGALMLLVVALIAARINRY